MIEFHSQASFDFLGKISQQFHICIYWYTLFHLKSRKALLGRLWEWEFLVLKREVQKIINVLWRLFCSITSTSIKTTGGSSQIKFIFICQLQQWQLLVFFSFLFFQAQRLRKLIHYVQYQSSITKQGKSFAVAFFLGLCKSDRHD